MTFSHVLLCIFKCNEFTTDGLSQNDSHITINHEKQPKVEKCSETTINAEYNASPLW